MLFRCLHPLHHASLSDGYEQFYPAPPAAPPAPAFGTAYLCTLKKCHYSRKSERLFRKRERVFGKRRSLFLAGHDYSRKMNKHTFLCIYMQNCLSFVNARHASRLHPGAGGVQPLATPYLLANKGVAFRGAGGASTPYYVRVRYGMEGKLKGS